MVRKASGALSTLPAPVASGIGSLPSVAAGRPARRRRGSDARSSRSFVADLGGAVDPLLEDGGGLEHHDPPRRDRHFLAGLGIAPDALALLAHHERAERGELHGLAAL